MGPVRILYVIGSSAHNIFSLSLCFGTISMRHHRYSQRVSCVGGAITQPAAGIPEPHVVWAQAPPGQPQASPEPTFCGRRHHPASRRYPRNQRFVGAGTTRPAAGIPRNQRCVGAGISQASAGMPEPYVLWAQAPPGQPQALRTLRSVGAGTTWPATGMPETHVSLAQAPPHGPARTY